MTQAQIQFFIRLVRRHPRAGVLFFIAFAFIAGLEYYYATSPPHRIASLINPAKLASLGARAANPRVQKYVAILEEAQRSGKDPAVVASEAVAIAGLRGELARLTTEAMLRNRVIAERLGCLNAAGIEEMRQGRAPTVTKGPYRGDPLSVDHIIPLSVMPEFDKVIANLELMPLRVNMKKRASMGERQQDLLKKLRAAGL
ncbi:MAG: hypothetical protein Q8M07_12625 [Prosthecobacter sp.]|nr:hypothetical protein [Prosthecobacter sp.]